MHSKCAAFWKHTNLRNDDNIYPCCRFKHPVQKFDGNFENILQSKEYQQLRESSSKNQYIDGCSKCYYEERKGKVSLRQKFNQEYDTDTVELKFLELGLDNICNLYCDGCYPEFSSQWSKIRYPERPSSFHVRSTKNIGKIPNTVDKILFLGGEPLMTNRHIKVLKTVNKKSLTDVIYNTNGTFLLDAKTIDFLKNFRSVHFIVSIDGYEKLNDKVRKGSKWNDVLEFIDSIKKNNFSMSVTSVLHINNWHGFGELQKFIEKIRVEWNINVLTYPTHLDIKNIDDPIPVINFFESIEVPNKNYIIAHIKND